MENELSTTLWAAVLDDLRGKLSHESFQTWLAPIRCDAIVAGDATGANAKREAGKYKLLLSVPNRFYADWINANYHALVIDVLKRVQGEHGFLLEWKVDESLKEARESAPAREADEASASAATAQPASIPVLQPLAAATTPRLSARPAAAVRASKVGSDSNKARTLHTAYRFDNFVVGPSNQLAHAAAVAVAKGGERKFNPLFIYGGVGLGKTHLVNAIGNAALQENPSARIIYVSAERFTNEFIWALQNHKIAEFRERYRNDCDILLMDDIQFLAGREQTQEEFFHTFNALHLQQRQIVLTSDVTPQRITEMEQRLVSRFQSGLVADIQAPELDTRVAIVQAKAEEQGIELASPVAQFVAENIKTNVREIEGTLRRLAVKAELLHRDLDLSFVKGELGDLGQNSARPLCIEEVQRAVCSHYQLRMMDIKSARRHRRVALPRMIAMYLCRQHLNSSYPEIGDGFGGKDHTTVINAVRKISHLIEADRDIRHAIDSIERHLQTAAS